MGLILSYIVTKNFVCKIINIRHKKEKIGYYLAPDADAAEY